MKQAITPRQMAEHVKSFGRYGDDVLVHMNRAELGILANAWPMTINPDTGQPEFFLQFLLPFLGLTGIEGALAGAALGAAGSSLMGGDPLTGALTGALGPVAGMIAGPADTAITAADQAANLAKATGTAAANIPIDQIVNASPELMAGIGEAPSFLESAAGWVRDNPMMAGIGLTAAMDAFSNKGPEGFKDNYDPNKYPEQFPANPRTAVAAPASYRPGVDPEFNFFQYGQNYAAGGPVSNQQIFTDYISGRDGTKGTTGGAQNFVARLLGVGPNNDDAPVAPKPKNISVPSMAQIFAGSLSPDASPAPVALYSAHPQSFAPNNFAQNLAAARPQGMAMGGPVRYGYSFGGMVDDEEPPQKYADPFGGTPFQFGLMGLLPAMWNRITDNTTPEYDAWMMKKKKQQGYAEGGSVDGGDKELMRATIMAIQGQVEDPRPILMAFIKRFGKEALEDLIARVTGQGQQDGRLLSGPGDGQSDGIMASVDGQQPAALSSGEFVIPAQTVAALGNGSNEAGAAHLQGMVNRVNVANRGTPQLAPPLDPKRVLPA